MIEECNFKSKIRHRDSPGCNLTPEDIVCPGEENCILYQTYKNMIRINEQLSLNSYDVTQKMISEEIYEDCAFCIQKDENIIYNTTYRQI